MYTDLESSPPQYRALCGILASLDLTQPDAPVSIKPEIQALLDQFSEADWDLFTHMAKAEGVAPLMYHAMTHSAFQAPEVTRQKLQAAYYESAAFNQMIFTEMGRVVQALNEAGIPVIVLKGAALATTIYPDPALRPMSDLDLLTAAPFVGKAVRCLRSKGYSLQKITNHAVLQCILGAKISIELHWTLAGDHQMSNKEIARFITDFADQPVSSTSRLSFDFLYLCAHLVLQHAEARLIWFYDHFAFFHHFHKEIDWNNLLNLADQLDWLQALDIMMQGINVRFDYHPPINFQNSIKESLQINKFSAHKTEQVQLRMTRAFFALSVSDRLLMALYFLFPSPGYLRWRYHSNIRQFLPFLYFYRLRDLVKGDYNGG